MDALLDRLMDTFVVEVDQSNAILSVQANHRRLHRLQY